MATNGPVRSGRAELDATLAAGTTLAGQFGLD